MKIITIANRKGGVGKSTTAFNLGYTYALKGKTVLFIDLDSQANLTTLCNTEPSTLEEWKAVTVRQVNALVSVLPACKAFSILENEIQGLFDRNVYLKENLLPKLPPVDYVIIDTPPALGILNINALVVSDAAHIVVNADAFSLSGLIEMREIIKKVQALNSRLVSHIVLNAAFRGRTFTEEAKKALEKQEGYTGIEIPHRQHIIDSNALRRPALEAEDVAKPFAALAGVL